MDFENINIPSGYGRCDREARDVLGKYPRDERPWLVLQAARSAELIKEKAKPLVPVLYELPDKNKALPGSDRRYKDGKFATFNHWSVKWVLHHCREEVDITW